MVLLEGREVEVAEGMAAALLPFFVVALLEFGDLFFGGEEDAAYLVKGAEVTEVSVETLTGLATNEREEGGEFGSFINFRAHQVYTS